MPHRDTSVSIKQAINRDLNVTHGHKCCYQTSSQSIYAKYLVHCNQSGVSILTNVFEVFVLLVKVNRRNYNYCFVIYITWLRQSCYIFIRLARIDIM